MLGRWRRELETGKAKAFARSGVPRGAEMTSIKRALSRLKKERYPTLTAARSDVFDYIERFHNPRMQRTLDIQGQELDALTQPSEKPE